MSEPITFDAPHRTETQRLADDIRQAMTNLRRDWPHMIRPGDKQAPGRTARHGLSVAAKREGWLWLDTPEHDVDQSYDDRRKGASDQDINRIDRTLSLRRFMQDVLNAWCRLIIEDRGITNAATIPLGTDVLAMAAFVERHADWLSGHEAANDCRDELTELTHRCHLIAFPTRRESISIGRCPLEQPGEADVLTICGGDVRVRPQPDERPGEAYAACNRCGEVAVASWWAERMFVDGEGSPLVTAGELVAVIAYRLEIVVTHDQIRQWKHRGKIHAEGSDDKGRTLYRHEVVIESIRAEVRAKAVRA